MNEFDENSDAPRLLFAVILHYRRWLSMLIPQVVPDIEISQQQLNVLYLVRNEHASMADMARILGVAPTVITGLVDRLEARGLIRRESHPTDRRRLQLVPTERGYRISEEVEAAIATRIDEQLALLDTTQQEHLEEGLQILKRIMVDLELAAAGPNGKVPALDAIG